MDRGRAAGQTTSLKFSDFTVEQDRVLLKFILQNSKWYNRYEIFQKAQEQNPVLAEKTILDLYLRFHRVLFPLFTGQPSDETVEMTIFPDDSNNFEVEEDRALLKFVLKNSKKYDRWSIFQAAQENESVLSQKTILELYLRYHRFLFPLFTGKLSDESVPLQFPLKTEEKKAKAEDEKKEPEDISARMLEAMEILEHTIRGNTIMMENYMQQAHKFNIHQLRDFEKKKRSVRDSKEEGLLEKSSMVDAK